MERKGENGERKQSEQKEIEEWKRRRSLEGEIEERKGNNEEKKKEKRKK